MHRKHRLSKNEDYIKVYKKGKSLANRFFVFYIFDRKDAQPFRLGISVSKKVGNAVIRNQVKRYVKAVIENYIEAMPVGKDFVLIARNPANKINYHETKDAIGHLLKKSKVVDKL
ncbi:ribonuclease P protein component [Desulfuribacillus stibiiarsenatis]|uniref:Ribonuclease P protein component n=1 Tax=Desulfuribacillus stibiiarsenatis TaxID=1390249 RepID=A0A1E5L8T9_9FIRM|nr:ribonuclease P protein component [Desulfuribacillus stibiiarsenatis]OEH86478.1 ribonuclease P protein component [Desulfuribacillus stibiiarsenatis]